MITFQQFLDKYNGRYIDYDKKYGYQCVDLIRQYILEVLGAAPYQVLPPNVGARQIYQSYHGTYFQKINNTPLGVPKKGDIIFWGWFPPFFGYYGHTGVVVGDSANINNFISFDQNYGRTKWCQRQLHDYKGVLGWLRKA